MATDGISWQELRAELETLRYELKADIAQIETHLVKWMVSLMVSAVVISSTIAVFAQRLLG